MQLLVKHSHSLMTPVPLCPQLFLLLGTYGVLLTMQLMLLVLMVWTEHSRLRQLQLAPTSIKTSEVIQQHLRLHHPSLTQ